MPKGVCTISLVLNADRHPNCPIYSLVTQSTLTLVMDTKNLPTLPNSTDSPAHTTSSSPPSTSNPHFPSTHPPTLDSPSHPTPSTSSTPTEHLHHHAHFDLALSPHPSRQATPASAATTLVDIEHSAVENDPRLWSDAKKSFILVMVSLGSLTPTIGAVRCLPF
jgi:hypothetical protein